MGLSFSVSHRIQARLQATTEFNSAWYVIFNYCRLLNQHVSAAGSPGIVHHQLFAAVELLYRLLCCRLRRFRRLVPCPPSRSRVHQARRSVILRSRGPDSTADPVINAAEFEDIALEVFVEQIVCELKWDVVGGAMRAVVFAGVWLAYNPDKPGHIAAILAGYYLATATLYILAMRSSAFFFHF